MTESASEAKSEDEQLTSDWACCCMFGFSCLKVFFKFKKMGHKCHTCFSCFRPTLISWKGTLHIQNIFLVLVDHSEYPKNIHTYIHTNLSCPTRAHILPQKTPLLRGEQSDPCKATTSLHTPYWCTQKCHRKPPLLKDFLALFLGAGSYKWLWPFIYLLHFSNQFKISNIV